ncbi:hypothetical protein JTB14_001885 [Gonioctena quinquepunctata]|nr:hypothetical protein JTB14_001885 [Gonioctena quinquepunctata]
MSARCEAIEIVHVETSDDCVVLPSELCEGVSVAGSIARPDENNMIPVKILNVRDGEVLQKKFNHQIGKIDDYELCQFNDNKTNSVNRVDHSLKLINTNHLDSEENQSIEKICVKYSDIFHSENDRSTVTSIYKQKIHSKNSAKPAYIKPYRLPHAQKACGKR